MKLLKEVKAFAKELSAKTKRRMASITIAATVVIGSAMTAMAEEAGSSASAAMSEALRSGLNQMLTDFIGYVAIVLPIGLTVFGTVFGVKQAKKFFSTVAK